MKNIEVRQIGDVEYCGYWGAYNLILNIEGRLITAQRVKSHTDLTPTERARTHSTALGRRDRLYRNGELILEVK